MQQVETVARFQVPRLVSCYMDVLRFHASTTTLDKEDSETLRAVPEQLHEFMEFGVSEKTQLSLMNLGFTRTTVVEVFTLMTQDNLTSKECLAWLAGQDLDKKPLPVLVVREIRRVLGQHGVTSEVLS